MHFFMEGKMDRNLNVTVIRISWRFLRLEKWRSLEQAFGQIKINIEGKNAFLREQRL